MSLMDRIWKKMMERWYIALLFMFMIGVNFGLTLCPILIDCTKQLVGLNLSSYIDINTTNFTADWILHNYSIQ